MDDNIIFDKLDIHKAKIYKSKTVTTAPDIHSP